MRYFTYNDYMDCQENQKIRKLDRLEEECFEYIRGNCKDERKFKIIEILKNKTELQEFLNDFIWTEKKIENDDITYYNENITEDKNIITCKIKRKEIFVIIKEIHKVDINITYKMLEHSIKIINRWKKDENINVRNPIVIPVVIYTGKHKWNTNNYQINNKINYIEFKSNSINFAYNLIKINELKTEELKTMKSKVSKEIIRLQQMM